MPLNILKLHPHNKLMHVLMAYEYSLNTVCCVVFPSFLVATLQMPTAFKKASSGMAACDFWRQHGNIISPHLRNVAQSVLGVPASAAVLERDLCVAGQVISRPRGSVGVGDMEMILFLRAAHDSIPKEVLALSEEQRQQAIPLRFKDADELNDVKYLDSGPENQGSSGSSGAEKKAGTEEEKELEAWLEMACPVPTDEVGYDSDD